MFDPHSSTPPSKIPLEVITFTSKDNVFFTCGAQYLFANCTRKKKKVKYHFHVNDTTSLQHIPSSNFISLINA